MIGSTVTHYKIIEKLGEGGMGIVYKAEDTKLDRLVALKFLPPHLNASEQDKARFIQEAKAAAALNHPNVCSVIDIQDHDSQMFIVMEFVDGQMLRERKNLSLKQALEIGIQIAEGLAAAHEKGIVHRDIKPENIMVRKDGIVQIMDFGLAKLKGVSRLTKEGSTVGTAGYMSPEQVQGQETDHRSDIFSLGIVLYEMITGQLPFKGIHETALMYEIVNQDPPPMSSVNPDLDPELDAIVLDCMAKEPLERYQSAAELARNLKRFKKESSRQKVSRVTAARSIFKQLETDNRLERKPIWKEYFWQILAGLFLIGAIFFGWNFWRLSLVPKQQIMRFSVTLPESEILDFSVIGNTLGVSPDGGFLVYNSIRNGTSQLFLRPMDQLRATPIPGTELASDPFFSPDGQWVAFSSQGKVKKVPLYGGAPLDICETQGQIRGGWWAKDGFIYYGHISKSIYRVAETGGIPMQVTKLDTAGDEISHRFPCVLPNGKAILFTIKPNNISTFDDALIAVQRLDTGERKILLKGGTFPRYAPTGQIIYARGKSLFAVPFDAQKLEITGPPVHLLDGGMTFVGSGSSSFGFSDNGTFLYVPGGPLLFNNISVEWSDRRGKLKPVMDKTSAYSNAKLSPDSDKLALDIAAANDDIWVYTISRGTLTRLTFGGGNNNQPIWSPDGKYVVYQAEKGGAPNLYRKIWDGSGAEERLTVSQSGQTATSWSPDGKTLAVNQSADIWMVPMDREQKPWAFLNSPFDEYDAVFSPDGKWVAYGSNESGKGEIYIVPFPNREGKWQISTEGGYQPMWANGELFYLNGKKVMKVEVRTRPTFIASVPQTLFELPKQVIGVADVSRDGQRFIFATVEAQELTTSQIHVVLGWFEDLKQKFPVGK